MQLQRPATTTECTEFEAKVLFLYCSVAYFVYKFINTPLLQKQYYSYEELQVNKGVQKVYPREIDRAHLEVYWFTCKYSYKVQYNVVYVLILSTGLSE